MIQNVEDKQQLLRRILAESTVRAMPNGPEKALYLRDVRGCRKCDIVAAGICSKSAFQRGKVAKADGRRIGHAGNPFALNEEDEHLVHDEAKLLLLEGKQLNVNTLQDIV
jgi:hypothetical protein